MDHHHEHAPLTSDERYREARHVTLVGSVVDLLLGVAKIIVGFIGHSQALPTACTPCRIWPPISSCCSP